MDGEGAVDGLAVPLGDDVEVGRVAKRERCITAVGPAFPVSDESSEGKVQTAASFLGVNEKHSHSFDILRPYLISSPLSPALLLPTTAI